MRRYKEIVGGVQENLVDNYVSSLEFDKYLVKHVAIVMLAHIKELVAKGIIPENSANKTIKELVEIIKSNGQGLYEWINRKGTVFEDVFEALEAYLYEVIGNDAGRIPLGRSRNDHVAQVLRLAIREHVIRILKTMLNIRQVLIDKASKYRGLLFPFFTHGQLAQCGSASGYFLTYEQAFADIFKLIINNLDYLSQNTLGSGASAGSYLAMDKERLSSMLCLNKEPLPPYYATGSRLFLIHAIAVLSMLMAEIGRFVEDMMFLNNVAQRGLEIPAHHVSTSSIMPHKRNLVSLEIARAKVSKAITILSFTLSTYRSLPYGYSLDFQEINRELFNLLIDVENTLLIVLDFIKHLELNEKHIYEYIKDKPCWSSDIIEYIAIRTGTPVRELYVKIASALRELWESSDDSSLRSFLHSYGINLEDVWKIIRDKPVEKNIDWLIEFYKGRLNKDSEVIERFTRSLDQCNEMLINPQP